MAQFDSSFGLIGKVLDVAMLRNEVIANNVANANTPGYRRKIVDFEQELTRALTSDEPVELKVVEADDPPGPNGNNVKFERELADLQKSALVYKVFAQFAASRVKALRAAIEGNSV